MDFGAGLWVAACARFALDHLEGPETHQGDRITIFQRFNDRIENDPPPPVLPSCFLDTFRFADDIFKNPLRTKLQ